MAAKSTTPTRHLQNYADIKDETIAGAKCTVRIIQDGAFLPSDTFQSRYKLVVDGCKQWSSLHHPNIVPFLGMMNKSNDKSIPKLLMEYFPTDLHQFLKTPRSKSTPLSLKISILQDVACGVTYLHDQSPPIIHGRLTAENILLDSGAVAKISVDLGVTILPRPLEMTSPYMPPEVTSSPHSPRTKAVDIYSVGILTTFMLTHQLPESNQATAQSDHISSQFSKEHPINQLINKCLSDLPDSRPTTDEVSSLLKQASIMIPDSFGDKTKIDVLQEMTILAKAHVEMRIEFEKHHRELRDQITGLLKGMEKQRTLLPHEYEDENKEMITEKEISYIANFIEGIPAKVLGLELGLSQHHLEIIMCDFHDENSRRLEVLSQWIKNDDPEKCTWPTLIKSLSSIGQKKIAQNLSNDKGLQYCEYITTEVESASTETEQKNETKQELRTNQNVSTHHDQLESRLQESKELQKRTESRLTECINELDEVNKKFDELTKEMIDKDKELTLLKRELKAEERFRKETAKENMELKLKVEQLKRK